jgi:hypothetical protein
VANLKGVENQLNDLFPAPHPHKQYSFCCFLINGKPVKKFSPCTTTSRLHTLSTYSTSVGPRLVLHRPPLHHFILFHVYRQKCHSASFIAPPLHATLFARSFVLFFTVQQHPANGDQFHRNTSLFISL